MPDPKSVESVAAAAGAPLERLDPTRLGPYTVLRRLGKGGMGVVYLARTVTWHLVAIKVIRSDISNSLAFRANFRREAATARRVARFCTAEVLDFDPDAEQPYLVTEYIEGPTLAATVASSGPLPSANTERLAVAVGAALTAIHEAGVVHQDLKPANVLMSHFGPRVIDFGIARSLDAATGTSLELRGLGTPAFMAPEQARGETVTAAADVFAWGGVVAFAGTGHCAFGEGAPEVVLYRAAREEPQLQGLEPGLRRLVEQTLSKNPADRPSATELLWSMLGSPPDEQQAAVTQIMHGWTSPRTEPTTRPSTAGTTDTLILTPSRSAAGPAPAGSEAAHAGPAGSAPARPADHAGRGGLPGGADPRHRSGMAGPAVPARPAVPPADGGFDTQSRSEPRPRRIPRPPPRLVKTTVAVLGLLVTALLAGLIISSWISSNEAAADVTREPVFTAGPNPFLPPVGTDRPGVQPPPGVRRIYPGNTEGLYAGTPNRPSCDTDRMAELLRRNPDRAAAWSEVLGIRSQDTMSYFRTLTPVILRTDTYVTNHRFVGSHAAGFPAVLQAGTAVLIDQYGTPVTKCYCGNPLTRPSAYSNPTFTGPGWPAFSPTTVTTIERTPGPMASFTLVDPSTERAFVRPGGTAGGNDRPYTPGPSTPNPSPSVVPSSGSPSLGPSPGGGSSVGPSSGGASSGGSSSVGPSPGGGSSGGSSSVGPSPGGGSSVGPSSGGGSSVGPSSGGGSSDASSVGPSSGGAPS
ncbi:serine/threonine-protein kinase [Protofrankia symbiont of Coriaria ruscifolia]|uniref:serine/threonine-protein kinase n=1 Tax=Protofrankia symbiont of Coriaria ruscifolia TaxID=1306542 RepID=UPI001F5F2D3A|nr:serine/threonine-protein kinase [Protofrankia symbiont of Coriaria ruscifolia]